MSDTVRVDGITYKIERVENLLDDTGDKRLSGQIKYEDSVIQIDARLKSQWERQVLWHEIFHGIIEQRGIEVKDEDRTVDQLAYAIMQVLRDNPWLAEVEP